MNNILLQCKRLCKSYREGNIKNIILNNINFSMKEGEMVAIIGNSGSGKSTLLHLLGGLDTPTSGEIIFSGRLMSKMSDNDKASLRNGSFGFIYQFHYLLSDFTALENVAMPLLISNNYNHFKEINIRARKILKDVGLEHRENYYPSKLSGGERQRVAIARALINNPRLILADEPTGNLDACNTNTIFSILSELSQSNGTALILVTHDLYLAKRTCRQLEMRDGILTTDLSTMEIN